MEIGKINLFLIEELIAKAIAESLADPHMERLTLAFRRVGYGSSAGYDAVKGGIFVKPFHNGRSSLVYTYETNAIGAGISAKLPKSERREIVTKLEAIRPKRFNAWRAATLAAAA